MSEISRSQSSFVFFGTPYFASCILQSMLDCSLIPEAVITMPDKPAGRGQIKRASAIKKLAQSRKLKILQPVSLNAQGNEYLYSLISNCDFAVVASYGYIIPAAMLSLPKHGFINVHASLLPRWRGAAPLQRAILAGDKESGISIMQMVKELDSGPVIATEKCTIDKTDTADSLNEKLAKLGAQTLIKNLNMLATLTAKPQDEQYVTYAYKIHKQDALINWQDTSEQIERAIRAFNPVPVAWTMCQGYRMRLWQAQSISTTHCEEAKPGTIINLGAEGIDVATGDGIIRIQCLQLAGSTRKSTKILIHGHKNIFKQGTIMGA